MGSPLLIVVSAPSGAGKTTLCDRLLGGAEDIVYSTSCTTRMPRADEEDGRDYHFLSEREFQDRIDRAEFMEHAVVHGHRYGTLRSAVEPVLAAGKSVLMDIDVQGARQIREFVNSLPVGSPLRRAFVDIFIAPPSPAALKERLEGRGSDSGEVIELRLRNAEAEMDAAGEYEYYVVNDDLDRAYQELVTIVEKEKARDKRNSR